MQKLSKTHVALFPSKIVLNTDTWKQLIRQQLCHFAIFQDSIHQQWPEQSENIALGLRKFAKDINDTVERFGKSWDISTLPSSPEISQTRSPNLSPPDFDEIAFLQSSVVFPVPLAAIPDASHHRQPPTTPVFEVCNFDTVTALNIGAGYGFTDVPVTETSHLSSQSGTIMDTIDPRRLQKLIDSDPSSQPQPNPDCNLEPIPLSSQLLVESTRKRKRSVNGCRALRDHAARPKRRLLKGSTTITNASRSCETADTGSGGFQSGSTPKKVSQKRLQPNLYSSMGSSREVLQLKAMIRSIDSTTRLEMRVHAVTGRDIFRALDGLDTFQQNCNLWRRMLLYRLAEHRDNLVQNIKNKQQEHPTTLDERRGGKFESNIKDTLAQEIYPNIIPPEDHTNIVEWRRTYGSQRKSVSNRLYAARNWKRAVERFQLGILALMPFGDRSDCQNYL